MRIAFAIEDQLGHRALLSNLKAALALDPSVDPIWYPVDPRGEGLLGLPKVRDKHALIFGLKLRKVMREAVRTHHPDGFFIHTQRMAHLAVDHIRATKSFISIDATPRELDSIYRSLSGRPTEAGSVYWKVRDAIHRRTYRAARGMITMSGLVADTLSNVYGVERDNVLVMLPGVDTNLWRPMENRAREEHARLLFVGGDFERKGGDLLLRWMRETTSRGFVVDIVTQAPIDPPPGVNVHRQFKPGQPGLVELVQRADLLVLPTLADMSPWVISEAKAAGTAVLSTNVGGIPELVREGIDGHIVQRGDYSAFATCIESMLANRDRLEEYGRRAREDAVDRLDAVKNANRLIAFMRERMN